MRKIGILTSGGDAPGMNACIRSIALACHKQNILPIGIIDGYKGLMGGRNKTLTIHEVNSLVDRGGTFLGSARCNDFFDKLKRANAIQHMQQAKMDGLIVIGGDGTFSGAKEFGYEVNAPIVGIPSTIDNDIDGTDYCIGFDTAVNNAMNAIDKLRDTANSHRRIFIVEVMGRHSGKLAKKIAACSGADFFLIPEQISDTKNLFAEFNHLQQNQKGIIIIVAEGDETGGALQLLKKIKPKLPECDIRCSILGHIQRGGSPTAFDRVIGTKMGKLAIDWITNGKSGVFTAFNNGKILPGVMKKKG